MSDNAKRTELLTQLFEQQLINADQLSRAKLYLQFISGTAFDTQDGAIDWLLENRIISERPVIETAQPAEQSPEQPSEETISQHAESDVISEETLTPAEPEEPVKQSALIENVEKEEIAEQQSEAFSIRQETSAETTESEQLNADNTNHLELLMLLYMAGTLNDKTLKKAKKALSLIPQADFKNSDELLVWLEQEEIIKPAPVSVEPIKTNSENRILILPEKKTTSERPFASVTKTKTLPPTEEPKAQKGGCLKKLIIIGIAIALITWYFNPMEAPACNNQGMYPMIIQDLLNSSNRKTNTAENRLTANPVVYRFGAMVDIKSIKYDTKTRNRTCKAIVVYRASGNDKSATDIAGTIQYNIKPVSRSEFIAGDIVGKDKILKRVDDENAYYEMLHEKDKPIKEAFVQGLAQVEQFINHSQYNQNKLSFISKNIRWIKVIGECQQIEDTFYRCPIELSYRNSASIKKEIQLTLDMPVIKKGSRWEPTENFYVEFLKVYASALKNAMDERKANEKNNKI